MKTTQQARLAALTALRPNYDRPPMARGTEAVEDASNRRQVLTLVAHGVTPYEACLLVAEAEQDHRVYWRLVEHLLRRRPELRKREPIDVRGGVLGPQHPTMTSYLKSSLSASR